MARKSIKQVLIEARTLISSRRRWTKYALARDKHDLVVPPTDPKAKCFCSLGAIEKVCGPNAVLRGAAQNRIQRAMSRAESGFCSIASVNDYRGHAATLKMFDIAIASRL
jgi:hypothetical protein